MNRKTSEATFTGWQPGIAIHGLWLDASGQAGGPGLPDEPEPRRRPGRPQCDVSLM